LERKSPLHIGKEKVLERKKKLAHLGNNKKPCPLYIGKEKVTVGTTQWRIQTRRLGAIN